MLSMGNALGILFLYPLFLSLLCFIGGVYAINRGNNLDEGEMVGGWGDYRDSTGFIIRGVMAIAFGIGFLVMAVWVATL